MAIVREVHGAGCGQLYDGFGDNFRKAVSKEKFEGIAAELDAALGKLLEARLLDRERTTSGARLYVAAFFERGTRLYKVSLDDAGVLRGLLVERFAEEEPGQGPADDYVAKRTYTLPCRGRWVITNGGRDPRQNHHVGNKQQWYAFDINQKGEDGKKHTGEGKRNEDFLAWGQAVVAPADGTVVTVVDGIPDHGPEHTDRYFVPGNLVVIDHGDGEFSFLAHFQRGSIVVKPGARVKQGKVLGKVGNSGNSSGPHIHWHLATEADASRGHGLPIRFAPMTVNGARVESPSPVRDDVVDL